MDTEMLYRTKLQEIEREAQHVRLVAAAKAAGTRPGVPEPATRSCPSMPLRLLRALRPSS